MIDLIILQILTWTSFFYTFTLGFFHVGSFTALSLSFFLHVLIITIHYFIQFNSFKVKYILLLCLLPVLWMQSLASLIFCLIYTVLSFNLSRYFIGSDNISVESIVKSTYFLLMTLYTVYFLLFEAFQGLLVLRINSIWPALGVYVLSSSLLLRTTRHADALLDFSKIRRSNILFTLGMIGCYFLIAMANFRSFLGELLSKFFSPFQLLLYPIYWFFSRFSLGDDFFEPFERVLSTEQEEASHEMIDEMGEAFIEGQSGLNGEGLTLFIDVFWRLLLLLFLIVVIRKAWSRLVSKAKRQSKDGIICEERSFIKRKKEKKRNFWLNPNRYPKSNSERIRYFYRRHLNLLSKIGLELKDNDTTESICKQATDARVQYARDIQKQYIQTRYGEKPCDERHVKDMKKWVG